MSVPPGSTDEDDGLLEALAEFREANDDGVRYSLDEVLVILGLTDTTPTP
jgi:hypothetical protein